MLLENGDCVEQDDEEQPCRCRHMPRVAQCLIPMVLGCIMRHVGGVCAREAHHLFGSWCQTGGPLLPCDQVFGLVLPRCEASTVGLPSCRASQWCGSGGWSSNERGPGLWSLGQPCSQSNHWHAHEVWRTCSQSTDGHHRRLRCMIPPSAASTMTGSMHSWSEMCAMSACTSGWGRAFSKKTCTGTG